MTTTAAFRDRAGPRAAPPAPSARARRLAPRLLGLAFLALALAPAPARADPFLLMAEEPGCSWCERWDAEIGPVYPKTAEGRAAPLRRYDVFAPPEDVTFQRSVVLTPTFVLVRDGAEVGRIEGYPGEDFFWGLLGRMLEDARIPVPRSG